MITIPIRIISPGSQKRPLSWGLQGEHNATQLQLDVRQFLAAWPDGTPALLITRQDGHPYLLDKSQWVLDIPTTNIVATLSNRETELLGRIELVVSWSRADGSIAKSQSYLGFISGNPTSSSLPLTPSVIEALDDLKEAGRRAEEAAERASAAAANATEAAAAVQTALLGDATEAYNTLGKLEDAVIAAQASADEKTTMAAVEAKNYATKTEAQGYATAVVGMDTDDANKSTVKGAKAYAKDLNDATNTRVEALETAIGEGGSVGSQIDAKIADLDVAEVAVGTGEIIEKISETDGKISVSKRALVASDIPTIEQSQVNGLGAALAAKQDTLAFQNDNYDKTTNKAITKSDLDAAVAGLTGVTHFKGVVESLPASAENGDIYIKTDGTEHIYVKPDAATEGHFEELGDQSSHIKHGTVVDSDIAANAAIAQSKIAGLTDALNVKANSADLSTMASETAADYIKKTDAPGYADILTATVAGTTYETKTDASAKLTEAKTHTTTELGKLNLTEVSAGEGKIISKISQANGKVSAETRALVATDIPTIEQSQVNGLGTALAAKTNDADLAAIAKDGNVNNLIQTEGDVLILNAGTAFDVDTSTQNAEEVSY